MGEVGYEASGGAGANRLRDRALRSGVPRSRAGGELDERLIFLGDDEDGAALEVIAVELEGGDLYVIHAMDLRERYRPR